MAANRPPKKTETLEIRLDHAAKDAFMARCRAEGRTASEALRGFIDGAGAKPRATGRWMQATAAALVGLAIGAVAAPSVAQSFAASEQTARFQALDRDHDGVLSPTEFSAR